MVNDAAEEHSGGGEENVADAEVAVQEETTDHADVVTSTVAVLGDVPVGVAAQGEVRGSATTATASVAEASTAARDSRHASGTHNDRGGFKRRHRRSDGRHPPGGVPKAAAAVGDPGE